MRFNGGASADRYPLIWNGIVYHDYDAEPVRLRNVSVSGALVQAGRDLPEGATVYLDLGPAGKLKPRVLDPRRAVRSRIFAAVRHASSSLSPSPKSLRRRLGQTAFGEQAPWAPGWRRSTIDEMAQSLGG